MDLTKSSSDNLADNSALAHAKDGTFRQISQTKGFLMAALQQLKSVTQLPKDEQLWSMLEI